MPIRKSAALKLAAHLRDPIHRQLAPDDPARERDIEQIALLICIEVALDEAQAMLESGERMAPRPVKASRSSR